MTFSPTKVNFVPEVPGHRESFLVRLWEILPGLGFVICGGRHCRRAKIFYLPQLGIEPRSLDLLANTLPCCCKSRLYSNVVECLPVGPATWVRFLAGAGEIFSLYNISENIIFMTGNVIYITSGIIAYAISI